MEVPSFQENTSIRDVYGIEIYRGPGEVRGKVSGSNPVYAACVWSTTIGTT